MSELLLSIVTVTKNCAQSIDKTLDSVSIIKQLEIEYLIIDAVSKDGTLSAVIDRGGLVDQLVSEPDSGIYNAMNKGVRLARGKYILFINGDDEIVTDGFSAVMDTMAKGKAEIICATTLVGDLVSPTEILEAKPWKLLFYNSIPHPSSFVLRELLLEKPFREDMRIVSDYDFFLEAYLSGSSFTILPVVTALHQRGGASSDIQRSQMEMERVRRDRLGWRYQLINCLAVMFRYFKRASSRSLP